MIKGLNFQPWISENYINENGKYGQLFILGESHYSEIDNGEEQKDFVEESNQPDTIPDIANELTSDVIKSYIDGKVDFPFYRNLGLLFNPVDKTELWKHVSFANGIQFALESPSSQPNAKEIDTIRDAFWLLLDNLNPDKVLVCSKRMWNYWIPEDPSRASFVSHIDENNKNSTIWKYQLKNKHCIAMGINHPSKYFSYNNWRPIVMKFLNYNS